MYNDIKLTADIVLCGFVEKFHKLVTIVCAGILPTPLDLAVKTQGLNLFPCIYT